jgi:nucleoside-diphosphate-sugar epimerase
MNPVTDPNQVINTIEELEEELSRPFPDVVEIVKNLDGDIMVLGAGGKVGPSFTKMALRAVEEAGISKKVIAVDLATDTDQMKELAACGAETIACNMLEADQLASLPDVENVAFLAGRKFGSTGTEHITWAMNALLPGLVATRFAKSKMVAFSTGCVYPFETVESGGSTEETSTEPLGDYSQSCLGRERMFEYVCHTKKMPLTMFRLNYSHEVRYGVLCDIAEKVNSDEPVDVTMGYFNVIWQRDVNAAVIRSFTIASSPPAYLNVTGKEIYSIRDAANKLGELLGKTPVLEGEESDTAFLSNPDKYYKLFGAPSINTDQIINRVAHWVKTGGGSLGKPTHFETKDGKY